MANDWNQTDWDDADFDDESDDVETLACPACGEHIYEDAQQCPHCGDYVAHASSTLADRPWWFVLVGVAGIIAFVIYSMQ